MYRYLSVREQYRTENGSPGIIKWWESAATFRKAFCWLKGKSRTMVKHTFHISYILVCFLHSCSIYCPLFKSYCATTSFIHFLCLTLTVPHILSSLLPSSFCFGAMIWWLFFRHSGVFPDAHAHHKISQRLTSQGQNSSKGERRSNTEPPCMDALLGEERQR